MNIKRIARHLLVTHRHVDKTLPRRVLNSVEHAIKTSEATHSGQVRFAVEGALDGAPLFEGQTARHRAIEVFAQLGIWDTEHNNGVLVYVLLADRAVEIVADRGVQAKVGAKEWEAICRKMETAFQQNDFEGGVLSGIEAVTLHLVKHFPAYGAHPNELPDKPVLL